MSAGYVSEELTVVWLLLIAVVVATYFIQAYRITLLPPSSSALLLGIFVGIASRITGLSAPLRFSPAAFFYALLPPIVFAAGFTLKKRAFFENIGAILTYAVLGTLASTLVFGFGTYILYIIGLVRRSHLGGSPFVECLMYGAAISSIDPVATLAVLAQTETPPILYNLVFGESVLNDAIAIVLFRSLASYASTHTGVGLTTLPAVLFQVVILSAGSLAVGVGVALACAFLLKRFEAYYSRPGAGGSWTQHGCHTGGPTVHASTPPPPHSLDPTLYEIAIVVMGSYLAYLVAEVMNFSGIVALFFSGICHAHYSHYNVSSDARIALRRFFEVGAFLCELFVFAYLGLQVATNTHSFDFGLFFSGIPLAIASRAANIFPCSQLINKYRSRKLPRKLQRMLWAVGLRGAVAYGLIVNMPRTDRPGEVGIPAIETAALVIVVISTLVLGSATGPLLRHLDLEGATDDEIYAAGWAEEGPVGQPQPPPGLLSRSIFHDRFKELDDTMLKPLFGGRMGDEMGNGDGEERDMMLDEDVEEFGAEGPPLRSPLFGGGGGSGQQQQQYDYFGTGTGAGASNGDRRSFEDKTRGPGGSSPRTGGGGSSGGGGTPIPQAHHHLWTGSNPTAAQGTSGGGGGGLGSPREVVVQVETGQQQGQRQQNTAAPSAPVADAITFGNEEK